MSVNLLLVLVRSPSFPSLKLKDNRTATFNKETKDDKAFLKTKNSFTVPARSVRVDPRQPAENVQNETLTVF